MMNAPKILAFAVGGEALTDLGADGDEDERAAVPEEAHRYAHRVGVLFDAVFDKSEIERQ